MARLTDGLAAPPLVNESGSGDEATGHAGQPRQLSSTASSTCGRWSSAQEQAALAAYQLAFPAAPPPGNDLEALLVALGGDPPTPQQAAELLYAYLNDWREELDDGVRNWATIGLAIAEGLFAAFQARRDLQNDEGENVGIDADPRARGRRGRRLGRSTSCWRLLDDPEPRRRLSATRSSPTTCCRCSACRSSSPISARRSTSSREFIDDNIVGPVRMALNPITSLIDELKEIPIEFIKD